MRFGLAKIRSHFLQGFQRTFTVGDYRWRRRNGVVRSCLPGLGFG